MNPDSHNKPDKFQQAWQAQSSQTRVTVDSDLLLKEVQRSQRDFRTTIFLRDFREVFVAILMLPSWFYMGITMSLPWTWYLTVPALIFIAGFMLVYRMRNKHEPIKPDTSLLQCVQRSLTEQEDQIWLLRNIFWWYLLPPSISILAFFAQVSWSIRAAGGAPAITFFMGLVLFVFVVYSFVYYWNQRAVRVQLEPRRQELLVMLASFGDESAADHIAKHSAQSDASSKQLRRWMIIAAVLILITIGLAILSGLSLNPNFDQTSQSSGPAGESLARLVTDLRKEKNLVGLAAMIMVDGQVEAVAAQGQRKIGSRMPLELTDQWHLGGITKSITATMIARLVESGQMQWSDTVGECFPEAAIHEDWKPVTLKQLLVHTAGAPVNFSSKVALNKPELGPECTRARREAVLEVMAEKPISPPGENFAYSLVGYTIAGAMAEKVTGEHWEDLVKREVFEPLKLTSAGFGPPKSPDATLDQPRGHRPLYSSKIAVGDDADNSPIMGPAATIHMTLNDLGTFTKEHMLGEIGQGELLSAETYQILHTPEFNNYACGWIKQYPSKEIPYTTYWHNGTNTLWYAMVMFIPEKNMVIAITSNDGDHVSAEAAAWEIVKARLDPSFIGTKLQLGQDFPKKSPFAAVRWEEDQPEVELDDQWFKLVSLNELSAAEIVAFSQQTHENRWRKRFEEDLVELLTNMGHPPEDKVTLEIQSLTTSKISIRENVPMTEENRSAIYDAALERELSTGNTDEN